MNKSELVEAVASQTGSSSAEARRSVEAVLHQIVSAVAAGDRVALTGFGSFEPVARAARTGRNPRTGESVKVRAATLPRFHSGAGFRAAVDSGQAPAVPAALSGARVVRSARATTAAPVAAAPDAAAPSSGKGRGKGKGKKKADARPAGKAPKKKDAKPDKKAPKGKKGKSAAKGKAKKKK